jgi:hypothetical protein
MKNNLTIQMIKKMVKTIPNYPDPNKKTWMYNGKPYSSIELENKLLKEVR